MKNTSQLKTKDLEEIKVDLQSSEEIEERIIKEHLGQIKLFNPGKEEKLTKQLIKTLNTEKQEGERNIDFENRVLKDLKAVLGLD